MRSCGAALPFVGQPCGLRGPFRPAIKSGSVRSQLCSSVGQVGNLRPIANRPAAAQPPLVRISVRQLFVGQPFGLRGPFRPAIKSGSVRSQLCSYVGQVANLRPIVNRPAAAQPPLVRISVRQLFVGQPFGLRGPFRPAIKSGSIRSQLRSYVGQVANLRPIANRPAAALPPLVHIEAAHRRFPIPPCLWPASPMGHASANPDLP